MSALCRSEQPVPKVNYKGDSRVYTPFLATPEDNLPIHAALGQKLQINQTAQSVDCHLMIDGYMQCNLDECVLR